jgi:hypothetical protein
VITFEDSEEERAWIAFVSGYINGAGAFRSAATVADELVNQLRERRKKPPVEGPYR